MCDYNFNIDVNFKHKRPLNKHKSERFEYRMRIATSEIKRKWSNFRKQTIGDATVSH